MNKIRKYIDILSSIQLWQTWMMYRRVKKPRSSSIRVLNRSNIYLAPSAVISMAEHSSFEINRQDYIKTHDRTTLYLGENAQLCINGRFTTHGHSSIMVHNDAKLEIGNNSYLNGGNIDCSRQITIGNDCAIADGVRIMDNSCHGDNSLGGGICRKSSLDSDRSYDTAWRKNWRWRNCGSRGGGDKRCAC